MAYATEAEWIAAQPTQVGKTGAEYGAAINLWGKQRPNYVDPMNYQTYDQYALAANPRNKEFGTGSGAELQNQANFYGMTIENYQNALANDPTKPMGQFQQVYGNQLLSPLQQVAAQTARAQGIGTMSPEVEALARANPEVFNAAAQKWSDYFKTTYPQTLEYQSVLSGPTKYSATGATAPKVSDVNSQFLLDPVTMQIIANPNYKPTNTKITATDVANIISGGVTTGATTGAKSRGLTDFLAKGGTLEKYNKNIVDWLTQNPNATDLQIRNFMNQIGVTPEDVATATGANLADIIARFQKAGGVQTDTPITGIDPIVEGQLRQLIPNFAASKQLASKLTASRPSTQSIVNMIQGKAPTATASNASLANVMSMIGQ
jgi:hypothetical protein